MKSLFVKVMHWLVAAVCVIMYVPLSGCSDNDEKETVVIVATEAEQREKVAINGNYLLQYVKEGTLVAFCPTCGLYDESPYKIYMISPDDRNYENLVDKYVWVKGEATLDKKIYYNNGSYDFYYTLVVEEIKLFEDYLKDITPTIN